LKDILDKYICRIEGHGYLKLNYDHAKVQLVIDEGERLFEKLLIGRPYMDAPFITARICGVCPTAHTLASINALENAFGITVNKDIERLRKVLLAGQIIQSHALHFFFLAAPDYIGLDNAFELADKKPEVFKIALALKEIGDDIVQTVGGRQVHPVTPQVGGFTKKFDKKDLMALKHRIEGNMHFALEALDLAGKFKYPNFENKTQNFALTDGKDYAFLNGKITSNKGLKTDIQNYELNIKEEVLDYSSAKHATHNKESFMVGALSRINLQPEKLNPKAKKAVHSFKKIKFPSNNPFHINLTQAVEMVHFMEEAVQCLDSLINGHELILKVPYKVKASSDAGAIEAPRGTLYHYYEIDDKGIIVNCDIITPTVQNLENIEKDAEYILKNTKSLPENERYHLLEMLVRAYDPCITCSVH